MRAVEKCVVDMQRRTCYANHQCLLMMTSSILSSQMINIIAAVDSRQVNKLSASRPHCLSFLVFKRRERADFLFFFSS